MKSISVWCFVCFFFLVFHKVHLQVLDPPYFNLADGRNITASSTCGENVAEPELYCKIVGSNWLDDSDNVNLIEGQACDYCDSNDPKRAHSASYAIDGTEKWWQSPPLSRGAKYSEVNLTVDLGQEFNVAYVFIKMGNSPRPGIWILERSRDFGVTYTPWQYFADTPQDCIHFFGKQTLQKITKDDSVICETKFSKLVPLENGEIAISLINGRPNADNFSVSTVLQEWSTATNIRLRFLRPKTTLGHLLSVVRQDPTVTRRYFYSIKDINIGGRCVCNGHASQCDQSSPLDPFKLSCGCQHHTCGLQCEKCCNGYQQYEWRRATINDPFVCEKCNCHGHSNECFYDANVAAKNQSKNIHGEYFGGGVCDNCQHNTQGINCEKCRDKFYRPIGKSLDAIDVCQPCRCNPKFSTGNCFDETGQCECRKNYLAPNCDQCSLGYFGYPECQECHCFPNGTIDNLCELTSGDCPCKTGYGGKYCKECSQGYFGFPDCKPCDCHPPNSKNSVCNLETGQCDCSINYGGRQCNKCSIGFFAYPSCQSCICTSEGRTEEFCDEVTGKCFCKVGYESPSCDRCSEGYYGYPNCVPCECNLEGSTRNTCDNSGKCTCRASYGGIKCDDCSPGFFNFPKCEECKCHWKGSSGLSCDHSGNCLCHDRYESQKCDKCKEGYYNFPACEECNCNPAGLVAEFGGCDKVEVGKLCECKERVKGRICNQCKDLFWNLQMNNQYGCEECLCNPNGTISRIGLCDSITGMCMCKRNVQGRTCNICKPNTYFLDSANLFGCVDCDCDIGGAASSDCDKVTGQCRCKSRIKGRTCSETIDATYFPTFYQFLNEAEDWYNPTGSPARFAYDEAVFPDYSWRGYATFSPLQKEIFNNITVTKTSIYKVIIHYVNRNNESINGVINFVPHEWMNDEKQSVSIVFEPSVQPKLLYATGRQPTSGTIALGIGLWKISLQVDKYDLFVDYVVLIPQAYYDQGLFQEKKSNPCLLETKNIACIKYSYPDYSEESQILYNNNAEAIQNDQIVTPVLVYDENYRDKLNITNQLIKMDNEYRELEFSFSTKNNGTNLLILNYHTLTDSNQSIPIKFDFINLNKNQTIQSDTILSSCPYLFICRQLVTINGGQVFLFDASEDDQIKVRFSLDDSLNNSLNVHSLAIIPSDNKWSLDFIKPKFVCIFKNNACISSIFPPTTGGFKIETEADQAQNRVVEQPSYKPINGEKSSNPKLTKLDDSMQSIDIRGSVPEPGSYNFVLHYFQPKGSSFEANGLIQDVNFYSVLSTIEHCPNVVGCRALIKQRDSDYDSTSFSIQKNFLINLKIPKGSEMYVDYLLVVPAEKFENRLLTSEPSDSSKSLLSECVQNNYFVDTNTSDDYCRSLIFSITTDFNGGALPCDCNIDGSEDHRCNSFGGQCYCKDNVIGRDCSKCKTGFYGFPNCKKCNCPSTAICHQLTGDCICPKGVTGKDCDTCLPLTFGFDRIIGCVDCSCNSFGVENRDLRCDLETGQCKCKRNIVGRTCDKCKPGFYGFPNCQLCRCDIRGTTPDICDQKSAKCFCKKNVDGPNCDLCKPDSYYLEEINPWGCTKCFCFGNTDRCTSSSYIFTQVSLANTDLELFNLIFGENYLDFKQMKKNEDYELDYVNENKVLIRTSFQRENQDSGNKEYHSAAYMGLTKEYLSNKITSYGGKLEYRINNKMSNNENGFGVPLPDVVLIGKNYTLIHEHDEQPVINQPFLISIKILEKEFKLLDGSQVTREQLMMTLINLQSIYIRAKYFDSTQESVEIEIQGIQMNVGMPGNKITNATRAPSIEQCLCPIQYKGTSCEECAEGYYRIQRGPYLGTCVPCNCNGHSKECDPITGKCFNCKYNTQGEHCEKCVEGYYGDATQGTPNDCIICACPLPIASNNFATSCEVSSFGSVLSCNCKEGYNGTRCEICAAGYFGQPQQPKLSCQKCQCNNNIDVTDVASCDPITGICQKCLFNSSGEHCEKCSDWFYGDSVVSKNCTNCSCNKCNSEYCDHHTGSCKCKPNVIGKSCEQCAPGFYGFSKCEGCQPCNCGEASHDLNCDDTGQCPCKNGVSGKNCDTCASGYWGYSKYGCTSCGCNEKFSRVKQCNQFTGQCQCLPGVVGAKCERCPDRWVLEPERGCQECGDCIHVLLNETVNLENLIEPAQTDIQDISSSVLANKKLTVMKEKLNNYTVLFNETFDDTEERIAKVQNFTITKNDIEDLGTDMDKTDNKFNSLEKNAEKALKKALESYNDAINKDNLVKSVKKFTVQVIENINQLEYNYLDSAALGNINKVSEADRVLNELKLPYFDETMQRYKINIEDFNQTLDNSKKFADVWFEMGDQIQVINFKLNNMTSLVAELKNLTKTSRENTVAAERIIRKDLRKEIERDVNFVKLAVNKTEGSIENAVKFNNQSEEAIDTLKNLSLDLNQQKARLENMIIKLNDSLGNTRETIPEFYREVTECKKNSETQLKQSQNLIELFSSTKNQAMDPLKAATAYNNISSTVDESSLIVKDMQDKLSPEARAALMSELEEFKNAMQKSTSDNSTIQLKNQEQNFQEQENLIQQLIKNFDNDKENFKNVNKTFQNFDSEKDKIENFNKIKNLVDDVNQSNYKINEIIESIRNLDNQSISMSDYTEFVNDLKESKDFVDRFQKDVEETKNLSTTNNFDYLNNKFLEKKSRISNHINDLKKRIQLAVHQVNNIRVGVQSDEGSVLELNNPLNMVESSTYNKFSMQFRALRPSGLLVYIGNPINEANNLIRKRNVYNDEPTKTIKKPINYDYMSLELKNGKVVLTWDLGTGDPTTLEDDQNVYDNEWHQVIVERFGRLIKLIVKTKNVSSVKEGISNGMASVFNLDRKYSKILIGGISENIQTNPSVTRQSFSGIVSNVFFDNEPLGLWNAKNSKNIRGAHAFEMFTENTLRFNGNSYVILARKGLNFKENIYVSFQFKTFNKNGLLFLVGDPLRKVFFSVEINNGKVVVKYELGSAPTMVSSNNIYNDGQWHFVKINREGKECFIFIDDKDEQSGFSVGLLTDLYTDDNIYIGGYRGINPYYDVTKDGFEGCIKELQIDSNQQNLNNNKEAFGVSLGCSTFVRMASFTEQAKAYIIFQNQTLNSINDNIQITFKFRTLSKTGLLMHITNEESDLNFSIRLLEGMLLLRLMNSPDQMLRTENQYYNDNKWHYITINSNTQTMEMNVDDNNSFRIEINKPIKFDQLNTIFVGGVPSDYVEQSFGDFIGCIGDITINYRFLNFADSNSTMNAQFKKCPLSTTEEEPPLSIFKDPITTETVTKPPSLQYLPPLEGCKLPQIPREETSSYDSEEKRFGNTLWSRYEFSISNDVAKGLENESGFQIQFKTTQAEGIIFYMTSSNNIDFVGLYFLNGKLHYSFDCGSGRAVVSLPQNFGDNTWHTVTFSRKGQNGLLRVDNESVQVSSQGGTSSLNVQSPIFIGGVSKELRPQIKNHLRSADKNDYGTFASTSFAGCLKNLKVRELEYRFKDGREIDVLPCTDQTEIGHFFHYDGGYIRLFDEFRVKVEFALTLEIRPRKPHGILAAVFGETDYLVLYMDKGQLYFAVDNGNGAIMTSYSVSNGLCDGNWHKIKAIKTKNIVILTINDDPPSMQMGPTGPSSTDTKDPFYIGGLPEKLKEEKKLALNSVTDDYLGCLRIISINSMPATINNAKIEGHITLNSCPSQ